MRSFPSSPELLAKLARSLANCPLFKGIEPPLLKEAATNATLVQAEPGEYLTKGGDVAEAFFVILNGKASALVRRPERQDDEEIALLGPGDSFGDVAVLLEEPLGASVKATSVVVAARFPAAFFNDMAARVPGFSLALARSVAKRLQRALHRMPLPDYPDDAAIPGAEVLALLPREFSLRHRVVPLQLEDGTLSLGFVDAPSAAVLESVRAQVPGAELRPVRIGSDFFEAAVAASATAAASRTASTVASDVHTLDPWLEAMVREGASDLHLGAGQQPKWRIDGRIREVPGAPRLGPTTAFDVIAPLVDERYGRQFKETNDVDFSYRIASGERFRVNLFRDTNGAGAVLRHIPSKIPTLATLGMPDVVGRLCEQPKGLVLVTGPTGSGKSTTLAAMVDLINETRDDHILTLEDPVEFVHPSKRSHVNQREVGSHTASFGKALRAALREDPDVVLVGEMRDLETVSLAIETANTGHLVLATLHTSTAPLTIARIVSMFPPEEQEQMRDTLADVLIGVVCQNLCRRIGGGRVAALEVMVVNFAIANLIRENKTNQMLSTMQTGKALGNVTLNESLAALVKGGKCEAAEVMSKAVDKADLAKRLGVSPNQASRG
jgi:twitching motility protein PilT